MNKLAIDARADVFVAEHKGTYITHEGVWPVDGEEEKLVIAAGNGGWEHEPWAYEDDLVGCYYMVKGNSVTGTIVPLYSGDVVDDAVVQVVKEVGRC